MFEPQAEVPARGLARFRQVIAASLALRWALVVTLVAGLGLTLMVHVVGRALRAKIDAESTRLTEIATQKMAERLDIEAHLADRSLRQLVQRYETELHSIARQPDTVRTLRDRDDQQVSRRLGPAFQRAGFDGGILVDARLQVLGLNKANLSLVASELALRQVDFINSLEALTVENDMRAPTHYRFVGPLDLSLAHVFQEPLQDRYGLVIASPVFDEFGEVGGLLIAYRLVRNSEPLLEDLARHIRADLALVLHERVLSKTGVMPERIPHHPEGTSEVVALENAGKIYRCSPSLPMTRLCVFREAEDINRFRDELQVLSASETDGMQVRLALFAAGLATLIGWLILSLTRRLTGPLTDIAVEVDRVAGGDFTTGVRHAGRADEVGRIARAIESMQYSLIERDRMRSEMARIDAINQRRLTMGSAISRFETGMSDVMQKISEAAKALHRAGTVMSQAARIAEEQADRIHATTITTATEASAVTGATVLLSRGIQELSQHLRSTVAIVESSDLRARETREDVSQIARLAHEAEDALSHIQQQVADMSRDVLQASIEAAAPSRSDGGFLGAAQGLAALTAQTGRATARIGEVIAHVGQVADTASGRLTTMRESFGQAQRDAAEMAVVMAEQDAARRAISDGLAGASLAMADLNESVDALRKSMSSAQRATDDVIDVARTILSDAQAIDNGLRSFVREVAA